MSDRQTVIYTARTMQDAHLLKNRLVELGIKAVVENDVLEQGSGVDIVGWPTLARVVVSEGDAPRARQLALEFESKGGSGASGESQAEPEVPAAPRDAWPRCPECDAPQTTRCPVCQTAGTDFGPADMEFSPVPGVDVPDAAGPSCGPAGCTPAGSTDEADRDDGPAEAPPAMLMCPTCDEPFTPEYAGVCEWCGHEFPDGYRTEPPETAAEEIGFRVVAALLGLMVLAIGLVAYFIVIF